MKIVIDSSNLHSLSKARGIGIYARQLFSHLSQVSSKNQYALATSTNQTQDADLIHYPNFDLFFLTLPLKKKAKRVVTVHDVTPLVFPDHFSVGLKGKAKFRIQLTALRLADAIVTDSKSSKQDIIKHLKIPSKKIHVVYLGVSKEFKPVKSKSLLQKARRKYKLENPFILYVGDVNYNKNVPVLIRAFAKIKNKKLNLVMVSKAWKNKHITEVMEINKLIDSLGLKNRVKKITKLPADSVSDLVNIYNLAQVYLQPSLYEGFGLPVLEAMACGTPVVATGAASLPEVTGSASIIVEPTSEGIFKGISKALSLSSKQKNQLINAGIKQAAKFTWEKTAKETIKVYNKILQR